MEKADRDLLVVLVFLVGVVEEVVLGYSTKMDLLGSQVDNCTMDCDSQHDKQLPSHKHRDKDPHTFAVDKPCPMDTPS